MGFPKRSPGLRNNCGSPPPTTIWCCPIGAYANRLKNQRQPEAPAHRKNGQLLLQRWLPKSPIMSGPRRNYSPTGSRRISWINCQRTNPCLPCWTTFIKENEGHYLILKYGRISACFFVRLTQVKVFAIHRFLK